MNRSVKFIQYVASVAFRLDLAGNRVRRSQKMRELSQKKPDPFVCNQDITPSGLDDINKFLEKNGVKPPEPMRSKGKVDALQSNNAPAASSGNGKKSLKTKFRRTGQTVFRALFRPARRMEIFKEVRSWFR